MQVSVVDQNGDLVLAPTARLIDEKQKSFASRSSAPGQLYFQNIAVGLYRLEITVAGFQPVSYEVKIVSGINRLRIQLKVAERNESVVVSLDPQEKALDEAFSNFLTKEQIERLPDDPEELSKALKQIAGGGSDVVIRVDGFSGADMPDKSKIASIKIVRSSYDAENHDLGNIYVDIATKVGTSRYSGSLSFNFNDGSFNARNAFSPDRYPEQTRNLFFFLGGPIRENKADFSVYFLDRRNEAASNLFAITPQGELRGSTNVVSSYTSVNVDINHNLTQTVPAKYTYKYSRRANSGLGVGGFDLPSRAYDIGADAHQFRLSTSVVKGSFLNEFRAAFDVSASNTSPRNSSPALKVLGAFSAGGAGNLERTRKIGLFVVDNLSTSYKQAALKVGFELSTLFQNLRSAENINGTYIFRSLADYVSGHPAIFSQRSGLRKASVRQDRSALYFQSDLRLKKNIILSAGVRYEAQTSLRDRNNFSPRLGLAWTPLKSGNTTFRIGGGIYYKWFEVDDFLRIVNLGADQPPEMIVIDPIYPFDPVNAPSGRQLPPSYFRKAGDLRNPEVLRASVQMTQRLGPSHTLRVEYIFERGTHLLRSRNINAPRNGILPNEDLGVITNVESSGSSVRNEVRVGFFGPVTKKADVAINYTLSSEINDFSGIYGLPTDNYDLRLDRGPSDLDRRHRMTFYLGWRPFKGVKINANYTVLSPLPFSLTTGHDDNRDTVFNDRPAGVSRNSRRGAWFSQLDLNLGYTISFGHRGKDSNKGFKVITTADDGFDIGDPSKRFSLRFFGNVENVFNHTNPVHFVGIQTSPLFLMPTSAETSRKITVGTRFTF
ncbi:MAG: TonB-dependent receptor [Acidobacteria bacterium]|nr:TonB-dependent receptor [Acidobacteriota bacterium]